jgi:hypothetical protein
MASSQIPDPLKRRHVIESDQSPAQALALAEAYLEEGRSIEAVIFLSKAEASDRLTELRREVVEAGDAFLLRSIVGAQGEHATSAEWSALARAAEAAGKERYATDARRQAARGEQ